ncbi:aldo/keto reductase [Microbacterium mitrae]|uniref:Aldo/keto reductase n=1 Tax=Microbacterium mitrae TaxID=664640 RepID=A0A5C8HPA8_9MICO|nr:aldo/keto reductase [Microbacterium mitrae]TXK04641.1 aldo/keto reductase [Microbacterium mitrae]
MTSGEAIAHPSVVVAPETHPSAPIPVQGRPIGSHVRVALGETGFSIFPVILGGGEFGWKVDQQHSYGILDRFFDLGGNMVHTADSFAAGRSELIIGKWMASRAVRDDIVLATRVGGHPDNPGLGSTNLVRAVEASLQRLGTTHIDVLYLDGTDTRALTEDTLATAEWLVETGKVRAIGAHGFSAERLVQSRILASAGYPRITVIDVPYNMVRRDEFDSNLRLVAGAQGLAVTPSHPLEHGFLSGAHRSRARLQRGVRGDQLRTNLNRRGTRLLRALDAIAAELGVPDAAIAIAWLRAQRLITAPIVNVYAEAHVDELMQGVGVSLGRANLAELTRALS